MSYPSKNKIFKELLIRIAGKSLKTRRRTKIKNLIRSINQYYKASCIKSCEVNKIINKKIIIANSTFGNVTTTQGDTFIYRLLKHYKAKVYFAVCNGNLSGCSMCEMNKGISRLMSLQQIKELNCNGCIKIFEEHVTEGDNEINKIIRWGESEKKKIQKYWETYEAKWLRTRRKYLFRNISVHEHASAALARYIGRPITNKDITCNARYADTYLSFLKAACMTTIEWEKIIIKYNPEIIVINHGLYVPQGIICDVAKKNKIKTSIWHNGYRKKTMLISKTDTYHKTLVKPKNFAGKVLSQNKKEIITKYLESRRTGDNDQITFAHKGAESNSFTINNKQYKKTTLVLTNVGWDAQCHYENNVYESMNDWLLDIIRLANEFKDHLFIFRCHPAEVTGRRVSCMKTSEFIRRQTITNNIKIISSEEKWSTYKLIDLSDSCIVYATKTAVEAACMGKPVLVCGESCLRNKGLTLDLKDSNMLKSYYEKLQTFETDIEGSMSYAYNLFFKEMIDYNDEQINETTIEQNKNLAKKIAWVD